MWKEFLKGFESIIFPHYCLSCNKHIENKEHIEGVCLECLEKISFIDAPFCVSCGKNLNDNRFCFCSNCKNSTYEFSRSWSVCKYEGIMLKLIHQFKYKGFTKLHRLFSQLMIEFIQKHIPIDKIDCIIAVPLYKKRLQDRGFNQAHLLSEPIAEYFKKDYFKNTVHRFKNTPSQTKLDKYKRFNNLKNAFCVKEHSRIKNKNIMIIDDVFTTGATVSELSAALKNTGANSVVSLTLAQ